MKLKRFIWIMSLVLITLCSHDMFAQAPSVEPLKFTTEFAQKTEAERVELLNLAANSMKQSAEYAIKGLFKEALPFAETAFKLTKEIFGEKHVYTLNTMERLSTLYMQLDRLDEALFWSEKTYRLSSEVLGEKHPDTLTSLTQQSSHLTRIFSSQTRCPRKRTHQSRTRQITGLRSSFGFF
jgi:hypothetical protein